MADNTFDWKAVRSAHFVGIGGIGMSALAQLMAARGVRVTGCDAATSELTERLRREGIAVEHGHSAAHITDVDLLIVASSVAQESDEVRAAIARGITLVKRAELLGLMMNERRGVAIAGTHGKTTTTAMVALGLIAAGRDPAVAVGGELLELGGNARAGDGEHFVAEADEFDRSFLRLQPELAVLTNIESDHLDYYGSVEAMQEAFVQFVCGVRDGGTLVCCQDDPGVQQVILQSHGRLQDDGLCFRGADGGEVRLGRLWTYGLEGEADWKGEDLSSAGGGSRFGVSYHARRLGEIQLTVPGLHNVRNAVAATAALTALGVEFHSIRAALQQFQGVRRRFELVGNAAGVTIIDDYAHHPTEIRATLQGARQRFPDRQITVVFQPHTASRTAELFHDFTRAFGDADSVVIVDIYRPVGREYDGLSVTSQDLAREMVDTRTQYCSSRELLPATLSEALSPGAVLITMGAGDIWQVGRETLQLLQSKERRGHGS